MLKQEKSGNPVLQPFFGRRRVGKAERKMVRLARETLNNQIFKFHFSVTKEIHFFPPFSAAGRVTRFLCEKSAKKRQFFRRKMSKIAENYDHNIEPRYVHNKCEFCRATTIRFFLIVSRATKF
jgi:hypothetical protein